jgi:muramoyltetrapeptide carboxypeptidase
MIPTKLYPGDMICVTAPSKSLAVVGEKVRQIATETLSRTGLKVKFSKNAETRDRFGSSSIQQRADDLHQAFVDPDIKAIITAIGGYNCNQLLDYLDYDLITDHPKILCGYSDISALGNALLAKTGLVTYSGPHFSTFGMQQGLEYTLAYFRKCLMETGTFQVPASETWSDDAWYEEQEIRRFNPSTGYLVVNEGQAEGRLVGGNLCTLNLLQGTEFMPSLENTILMLEDDMESQIEHFDRDLQSLIHQPGFGGVQGLIIGRFQTGSHIENEALVEAIKGKRELNKLPVITNANFGHCTPQFTFPIGGTGELVAEAGQASFTIIDH